MQVVCDKDGVSGAAVFAEMVGQLAEQGLTVKAHLQALYAQYGEFVSLNSYVFCHDPKKTDEIFLRIRKGGPDGGYWPSCAGEKIDAIKDVTLGFDSEALKSGKASDLPATPDSHMIMFEFANGVTVTLRTSGTEPKIKFYTEIAGQPGEQREALQSRLEAFVERVVEEMLQPTLHGLARP